MTEIINSLEQISEKYNVLLCDIWGCIHNGQNAIPSALKALYSFKKNHGYVMLLTNAPRPKSAVKEHLETMNITGDYYDDITTSGDAAQLSMFSGTVGYKVYHLGPERDESFFIDHPSDISIKKKVLRVSLEEAEGIVCTGLFDDTYETPENYKGIIEYGVEKHLKLLCVNPDIFVDIGHKRVWCAGGIAEAFSKAGGESIYCGKPHRDIYKLAFIKIKNFNLKTEPKILCIGDGIKTDVLGGVNEGLDTLFICGGLASNETGIDKIRDTPDRKKLNTFLAINNLNPTNSIGFLK
ncbi:MAG: TIGR01459 family HAD-type hydrolase [Rhodobacteraceae bacterium]|nr:TIGR01459 family HAD-type hydrolase [Paracoccaceae bacterium]